MVGERIEKNISDTSPKCVDREGLGRRFTTDLINSKILCRVSSVFTCSKGSILGGAGGGKETKKSLLLRLTLRVERRLHCCFLNFHKQRVNEKPSFSSMRKKCLTFTLKFWLELFNRRIEQSQPPGVEENPHLALIPLPLLIASCLQENFMSKRNQGAFLRSNEKRRNS